MILKEVVMRIVAGKYRHRLLVFPEDNNIRPTKDRIREALFSSLGNINNYQVLDLYAGSGAMGIEAISRGASHCYFVDINKVALKTIKDNIANLQIDNATILNKKDVEALEYFAHNNIKFDLIILDPPYKEGKYNEVITYIINNDLLIKGGVIVTECNYEIDLSNINYQRIKKHSYGEIKINILYF